jgi:hypothetical protein
VFDSNASCPHTCSQASGWKWGQRALVELKRGETRGGRVSFCQRWFCIKYGVRLAAPLTTLLSWCSALLWCKIFKWDCVCAWSLRLAGSWRGWLASYLQAALLSCFASCFPFIFCLPPPSCVSELKGSDRSLSQQRLQKGESYEIKTFVDSTSTLKSFSYNTFKIEKERIE